jgi:hypothetical protein
VGLEEIGQRAEMVKKSKDFNQARLREDSQGQIVNGLKRLNRRFQYHCQFGFSK